MCTLKCYHMTYTLQSERGIHMEIAIMILGICAVILLAAAFFGILKKSGKDGEAAVLSDISGVEKQYNKLSTECGLIYISVSYKSNTHNALKQHYFTDKEISEFCTAFGCRGAKADGSNYLVAARLDKDSAESFCRSFSGCEDKYPGIGDINIGVYVMPDNSGDFKRAAGYAKKIARHAKNNGGKYVISTPENLGKIIEDDNIEKNIASEYPGVKLTVSIGGACDEGKISQILRKADIAMYEAKIKRNGICMYEDR